MDARGVGDDAVPMAVSDSESTDEGAGVAAHPQHTSKVVAVNPFFLERHLGPRATHPDGSANVRAQLTTLWVLGQPGRPQREPPADVPGLATLGERERPWCSCLPTRCGPCHGGPASEPPSGSFDWGDESDTTDAFARRVRCAPTAACAPGRADDDDYDDDDDDDDEVDPVSAAIAAESRRPGRPSRDAAGCLTGCDASDWSENSDGTRRRRGRKGCLAGCDGDEDPITGERSRGCLSPAFDLVDGVRDPKTGARRGGCYACMNGEVDPETGERRGGCLDPITGCIFGFEEDEYDDPKDPNRRRRRRRRRGGCLGACVGDEDPETGARRGGCLEPITGCIFGFEADTDDDDSKDPNRRRRRRRRRGGCLGACLGDEDPETGARRGGCAGCFLGDVDPETGRRRGVGLGDACVGAEDPDTGARRGGCLASCVGEEDPETGRRRGGCLTACLFGSEDRDGNRRDDGCLAGCDDDQLSDDSDRDAKEGKEGDVRARRRRGCLADAFRALCGVGASARRRRRRRDRRRRGLEEDEEDDDEDGDSRRDGKNDGASSSSDSNADDAEWAEAKWRRKSMGYLDVRVAALNARTRAPTVAYEFARPSAVLSALLAAFFAPATWRVLSRAVGPPPGVGDAPKSPLRPDATAEERRARARDVEEAIVDEITHRTLPFLFNRDVEMLGATLGATFFAASVDASVRGRRKEEMFWLAALFPQWLAAARDESRRLRRRRDDVVRMRWHARRRRKRLADAEKWEDVLATETPAPALALVADENDDNDDDDDDDEKGKDPKRRGWEWPSFALPSLSLPSVSLPTVSLPELRDVEIEWRSQTNPDNESRVDYDATVDAALRASVRRHKRQNRKMRAYWAGDADASRTAAKPVDDLKLDDDVDRTIGPTPWKAAS